MGTALQGKRTWQLREESGGREVVRPTTEKDDASSDETARSGGKTLTVGIVKVEEEGGTEIVDGNGRLKAGGSK